MPPQDRNVVDEPQGGMRRVTSESDMSQASDGSPSKEYHVRKSRLIGYVFYVEPFHLLSVQYVG